MSGSSEGSEPTVCVVGAGAVGGCLAAQLVAAGVPTTVVARGASLAAIRERGLTLRIDGGTTTWRPARAVALEEAGPHDLFFITTKAYDWPAVATALRPVLGPETVVATVCNGIPWWYTFRCSGPLDGERLASVDPDGSVAGGLGLARALGVVPFIACSVVEPGVVQHVRGKRLVLGDPSDPSDPRSERVQAVSRLLIRAGFDAPASSDIRGEIWSKAWGNLAFNGLAALTLATVAELAADPGCRALLRALMLECRDVAHALGVRLEDADRRIDSGAQNGAYKPSMLQDVEHGRRLETGALFGAVAEVGDRLGVPTPMVDALSALLTMRGRASQGRS